MTAIPSGSPLEQRPFLTLHVGRFSLHIAPSVLFAWPAAVLVLYLLPASLSDRLPVSPGLALAIALACWLTSVAQAAAVAAVATVGRTRLRALDIGLISVDAATEAPAGYLHALALLLAGPLISGIVAFPALLIAWHSTAPLGDAARLFALVLGCYAGLTTVSALWPLRPMSAGHIVLTLLFAAKARVPYAALPHADDLPERGRVPVEHALRKDIVFAHLQPTVAEVLSQLPSLSDTDVVYLFDNVGAAVAFTYRSALEQVPRAQAAESPIGPFIIPLRRPEALFPNTRTLPAMIAMACVGKPELPMVNGREPLGVVRREDLATYHNGRAA